MSIFRSNEIVFTGNAMQNMDPKDGNVRQGQQSTRSSSLFNNLFLSPPKANESLLASNAMQNIDSKAGNVQQGQQSTGSSSLFKLFQSPLKANESLLASNATQNMDSKAGNVQQGQQSTGSSSLFNNPFLSPPKANESLLAKLLQSPPKANGSLFDSNESLLAKLFQSPPKANESLLDSNAMQNRDSKAGCTHLEEPFFLCQNESCYSVLCLECIRMHPLEHKKLVPISNSDDSKLQIEKHDQKRKELLEELKNSFHQKEVVVQEEEKEIDLGIENFKSAVEAEMDFFSQKAKEQNLNNCPETKEVYDEVQQKLNYLETLNFKEGDDVRKKVEKIQKFLQERSQIETVLEKSEDVLDDYRFDISALKRYQDLVLLTIKDMKPIQMKINAEGFVESNDSNSVLQREVKRLKDEINKFVYSIRHPEKMKCGLVAKGTEKSLYFCSGEKCRQRPGTVLGSNPYKITESFCLAARHCGLVTAEGGFFHAEKVCLGNTNTGTKQNGIQSETIDVSSEGYLLS